MPYLTINGTEYMVREGQSRASVKPIEVRRRGVNGALLVDHITHKIEATVEIAGLWSADRFFTPAEADALAASLIGVALSIGGDFGTFTARVKDVSVTDLSDRAGNPAVFRILSVSMDEV